MTNAISAICQINFTEFGKRYEQQTQILCVDFSLTDEIYDLSWLSRVAASLGCRKSDDFLVPYPTQIPFGFLDELEDICGWCVVNHGDHIKVVFQVHQMTLNIVREAMDENGIRCGRCVTKVQ